MIWGRSSRMVGSPPDSWILQLPALRASSRNQPSISSRLGSGSKDSPEAAKHTGQARSQREVTSRSTQQVCCSCFGHRPQSRGQPLATGVCVTTGLLRGLGESQAAHSGSPRQTMVLKLPCSGQVLVRYTSAPSRTGSAGILRRHEGHRLSVGGSTAPGSRDGSAMAHAARASLPGSRRRSQRKAGSASRRGSDSGLGLIPQGC
jgi:hypothetical protein